MAFRIRDLKTCIGITDTERVKVMEMGYNFEHFVSDDYIINTGSKGSDIEERKTRNRKVKLNFLRNPRPFTSKSIQKKKKKI